MESVSNKKCFHEFPVREIKFYEMLQLLDDHDHVILTDEDYMATLFEGRVEDLKCTPDDAVAHDFCEYIVRSMDISANGRLMFSIYQK